MYALDEVSIVLCMWNTFCKVLFVVFLFVTSNWYSSERQKWKGLKAVDKANQCCQWPDWLLWLRPVCANCRVMPSHQGSAARLVYNQHSPPTPPHNHQCTLGKSSCACFLNCIVCFARSNRKWPAMIYHGANNRMSLLVILLLIISICSRPQCGKFLAWFDLPIISGSNFWWFPSFDFLCMPSWSLVSHFYIILTVYIWKESVFSRNNV